MATKTTRKSKPVEEVEDEDVELEDIDEEVDDDEDEAPAKSKTKTKAAVEDEVWGVQDLIKLIKRKTGKEYKPREVRTLLRRLARDGSNRVNREIIAGNKARYAWSGPEDPEVKTILKAVSGGEIETAKKEALDKLKTDKAKKDAAKAGKTDKVKAKKKKAPPPPDDDEDEDDEDDE